METNEGVMKREDLASLFSVRCGAGGPAAGGHKGLGVLKVWGH